MGVQPQCNNLISGYVGCSNAEIGVCTPCDIDSWCKVVERIEFEGEICSGTGAWFCSIDVYSS